MSIKAKKSLGQNFLIDKNIINKIISVGDIKKITAKVDLPEPEGPMTETNSPASTLMDTPRSARTLISPRS